MIFARFFLYGFHFILPRALQAATTPEKDRESSSTRLCPSFLTFHQPPSADAATEDPAPLSSAKEPDPLYKRALQKRSEKTGQQHFSGPQMTVIKKGKGGETIYVSARKDPKTGHFVPIFRK